MHAPPSPSATTGRTLTGTCNTNGSRASAGVSMTAVATSISLLWISGRRFRFHTAAATNPPNMIDWLIGKIRNVSRWPSARLSASA
jgi:hypothetical protein